MNSQSCNFLNKILCWKTLGIFPHQDFEIIFFFNAVYHLCLSPYFLRRGRHHHIKGRRNSWFKNNEDGNNNIFFDWNTCQLFSLLAKHIFLKDYGSTTIYLLDLVGFWPTFIYIFQSSISLLDTSLDWCVHLFQERLATTVVFSTPPS